MDLKEIEAKSILVKSNLPDTDYVINPYTGCSFGCTYCYASFMGRFNGKTFDDWGKYVFAKTNAPKLLERQIKSIKNKGKGKTVFLSSVTDPYQGIEAKYKLTRQCLQTLFEHDFQGLVAILTKSDLVLRDLNILQKLHHVEAGLTITSTDDSISRYFEKYAPAVSRRLKALATLNKAKISTYAFIGPLLPHYISKEKELDKLLKAIADTGTKEVYVEHINLTSYILGRLRKEMKNADPKILDTFYKSKNKKYQEELDKIVEDLCKKHKLKIRLGKTIKHGQ
ncbi:hypothetical protein A2982_03415 [candidate division WWE3 bacterium RIFCSPLOWO2_01_FULL_39_13]|uniref:Elp3/MiaA/NifB-like radical SAM core domain-containing protein n=1 Tax=candidate division WWE3 bacterium RIFCSPLOWO2_01_FULL_39_13 TaxID=1802624 RepID=A0A1F4V3E1_UNCKA|nr:MAG: hypothetical protein A2982_03415 [candidate division WWE3 bacterium RIFCSPLOWO2_01_FULL_39_13]